MIEMILWCALCTQPGVPGSNPGRVAGIREPKSGNLAVAAAITPHNFWDRKSKFETASMVAAGALDMGITCHFLTVPVVGPYGRVRETNLTQSCGADVALTAGFEGAALGLSYLLHKKGRHKLELLPRVFLTEESIRGIVQSAKFGAL
jgi:hypothetical protein